MENPMRRFRKLTVIKVRRKEVMILGHPMAVRLWAMPSVNKPKSLHPRLRPCRSKASAQSHFHAAYIDAKESIMV